MGKHEANTRVERSLYQKAVGYDYPAVKIFMPAGAKKPVYAPYVEHVPPDVTACIFWLKKRDPAHWRDAWQVDHTLGKYHRATKFSRCFDGGSELRPAVDGVGALARLVLLESSGDGEALRLREGGDGVKLGGWTAGSERSAKEAAALAERMRPVMAQLAGLSAHKAAAELNRRKIASATGGKWYAATVIKLRDRLEA